MMTLSYITMKSPVGLLTLIADDEKLRGILFEKESPDRFGREIQRAGNRHPVLERTKLQLEEYFQGRRHDFDIPLHFEGTEFQKKVWKELRKIPYGKTRSYGEVARKIGSPGAQRAVGAANGRNPIPIIVPCHRVIGASGDLTGFGGGLPIKTDLLRREGALP